MTIEWLAGNRIRGTTAERPSASLQSPSVGGWVELARTTLGSANSDIDVTGLADKQYLMILSDFQNPSSGEIPYFRAGNGSFDSGNNYASRSSSNGASPDNYTVTSNHNAHVRGAGFGTCPHFDVCYIANLSGKEKLSQWWNVERSTAGAGASPNRDDGAFKHDYSNSYDQIQRSSLGSTTYASGSEVVVLGWDPSDTHTTNFWEELASVELSSASNSISTGTFIPKKYMWLQYHIPSSTGSANNYDLRVGNNTIDSGSNRYAFKYNINGANGDTSVPNQNTLKLSFNMGSGSEWSFGNVFIINNASTEKLFISQANRNNVSGAGTAPNRHNVTGKWIESTNQINIMELFHQTGASTLGAGTIMKVWGSD